jgi:phosphoserine phosphatase RsbU/P
VPGDLEGPGPHPFIGVVVTGTAAARLDLGPLAAVVDRLSDGVAVLAADGTLVYLNPAGARLLGRRPDALLGRGLRAELPGAAELLDVLDRAAGAAHPVTWRGRYPVTGAWLTASAVGAGDQLLVSFRELEEPPADGDRDRLAYLAHVTETMISTLDTGESTTRLAELVVERLCDWAVVVLTDDEAGDRAGDEGRAHRDPARRRDVDVYRNGRLPLTSAAGPIATALLTGEPVQLVPLDENRIAPTLLTEEVRAAWRRLDTTSAVIVPLRARGQTFGALAMMNSGARPPHTATEIATAVEVARRGALALDNARLYGRQLDVAETLQHSLLTPPPRGDLDPLQLAVRYRPAASHQAVGGDWYDAFVQPDGALALVIGDVVGHNVEATAAMSQIRSMLRALAHDQPGSPARTLSRLDRALSGLHVDKLATVLLGSVGPPDEQGARTLRWSSAGHVPPALLHPDGRVQVLDTRPERLLGAGWTGPRHDHEIPLRPGDTVLLVTDGLIEHGRCDLDAGMARLTAVLAELTALPVEELGDRLLDRIVAGRAEDDVALLILRCQRPAAAGPH